MNRDTTFARTPKFAPDEFDFWAKMPKRPDLDKVSKLRLAIIKDNIQRLQERARQIEQGKG